MIEAQERARVNEIARNEAEKEELQRRIQDFALKADRRRTRSTPLEQYRGQQSNCGQKE